MTTFGDECNYIKEQVKHALNHEIAEYEDDNGNLVYVKSTKEDTDALILEAFDQIVYHALQALACSRAFERLYKDKVGEIPFVEYGKFMEEEIQKFNDYQFENEGENNIVEFPGLKKTLNDDHKV